jgi:SPP1 family phage portal protein
VITINNIEELTTPVIKRIIDNHRTTELVRLLELEKYYNTENKIKNRMMADTTKPNNKIANPYASYITDTLTGYFIGEPIVYNSEDKNLLQDLTMIFEYNDEADENAELAKNASIYGVAYEMLYISEADEKMVRFKALSPKECIPIFDKTIEQNLVGLIRYYDDKNIFEDKTYTMIEVITDKEVITYRANELATEFVLLDSYPHYFGMVPIAIYKNNEEQRGDFESVISLIDAYDKLESDSVNDSEYFADCYLALHGFAADQEDIKDMKEKRVILMDNDTSAEWLVKESNDVAVENIKNRLDKDIHKFTKCPNMSDQEFASNASGIAIKFKLLGTENLVAIKERKFKRGLQQRLELIAAINSVIRDGFDWRAIEIIFSRNIPTNDMDIANMVNTLKDIVSNETLLSQIPFVENVQDEVEKLNKEKEENPFFQVGLNYETGAMVNANKKLEGEEDNA